MRSMNRPALPILTLFLFLLPACGEPCMPTIVGDGLNAVAEDACLPDGDETTHGVHSTGMDSTEGHSTVVQTQTSAPDLTTSGGTDATASSTDGSTSTSDSESDSTSGTSSTGDVPTTGGGDGGGDTGVLLGCFSEACDDDHPCGKGMFCGKHPLSNEAMCVFFCAPNPVCDGPAKDVSCSELESPPACLPVLIDGVEFPVCFPGLKK